MYRLLWYSNIFYFICLAFNNLTNAYFISVDETKFHLAKSYLCRYGYMNANLCQQHADDSLKFMQNNARDMYRGLLIFQTMFNITRTGKIDEETIMQMSKPRCGNKDFDLHFNSLKFSSHKSNDITALRNGLHKLSYTIRKYNPYLNRYSRSISDEMVEYTVDRAFQIWLKHFSDHIRVTKLKESDDKFIKSNITIYFAEGNHGDSMLFDGIDGELAHSYSLSNYKTPFRGHIHLDDAENWGKDKRLLAILLHQIGHLFGLDHSSNPKSIMSPAFKFDTDELQLEDVRNLKLILGLEKSHNHHEKKTTIRKNENTEPLTGETQSARTTNSNNLADEAQTKDTKKQTRVNLTTDPINETLITQTTSKKSELDELTTTITAESSDSAPSTTIAVTTTTTSTTAAATISNTEATSVKLNETSDSSTILPVATTAVLMTNTTSITPEVTETTASTSTTSETTTEYSSTEDDTTTTTTIRTVEKHSSDSNSTVLTEHASTTESISTQQETSATTSSINETTTINPTTSETTTSTTESTSINDDSTSATPTTTIEAITNSATNASAMPVETSVSQETTIENKNLNITATKLTTNESTIALVKHEEPTNLCEHPQIDAITRTEWGNAFVFRGNYVWHIRGLTKWRLFDYDGWPKLIQDLFPGLPGKIDSAFLHDDQYFFTKDELIWKYKILPAFYPPKYSLTKAYPRFIKEEFPNIPFDRVDGAFSTTTSVFLFKNNEFWQSEWTSNITGKIPFKVDGVLSWRNPRLDSGLNEPLAYIISNSSMYKFNYWSFPVSYEALDIRYFLFDCVQANYQPNNAMFIGPSYKQAFIADDIYSKEQYAFDVPAQPARLIDDSMNVSKVSNNQVNNEDAVRVVDVKNMQSISANAGVKLFTYSSLLIVNIFFIVIKTF